MITIAVGESREQKYWKNTDVLWSGFVNRLSEPHYTSETAAAFAAAKKSRQTEIKDVGGFIGGMTSAGRRKKGGIANRILLTLDIDNTDSFKAWDDYKLLYGNAAVIYTTHKHMPEKPRYRLCILLDHPVFADEYEAIARRVAERLGIEQFDPTTFEPHRLMFWQSTPKDGKYVFDYCDGDAVCADDILNSYSDWRDVSQWAMHKSTMETVQRDIKKQGDPTEKTGLIGAFCRRYSITETIDTFLQDEYESCGNGRYTYRHGSTAAGLVIYEDKFAYSHHGTDPAGGRLCNAFDLVRLHKFGLQDDEAKENTPVNKLPSHTSMTEFIANEPETRKLLLQERFAGIKADFDDGYISEVQNCGDEWLTSLEFDSKGRVKLTTDNIIKILNNDAGIKGKFALNTFAHRGAITGNLPWREYDPRNPFHTDVDDAGIRHHIEAQYGILSVQRIKDGLSLTTLKNQFHPVKEYLNNLVWDGKKRVDTLLIDYFGAPDTEYTRAVMRKALTAAVARIFKPGVKFDYILTIVGAQGLGKTTFFHKLGGKWFSNSFSSFQGKDAYEQVQGVWIIELGELAALNRTEREYVKHFITKQEDIFRKPYGYNMENYPRQCVFFATTNISDFLKDPTGGRRFWPVDANITQPVKSVFTDLTPDEVGQIWAEAVMFYTKGETLFLPPELEAAAGYEQDSHSENDEKLGLIQRYLDMKVPENWYSMELYERRNHTHDRFAGEPLHGVSFIRHKVCILEIWCELFERSPADLDSRKASELRNTMMKVTGWQPYDISKCKGRLRFGAYGLQKAYVRII